MHMCVCAKSIQSCLTLCKPMEPMPGSSVHGILHTRILEWVAMPSSRGSSQPRDRTHVSKVWEYISLKYGNAAAKLLQSCLTLCDPIDSSPPGSPVPGILQARTLEWVAISFSNMWKWKVKVKLLSHIWLIATPWTAAHQAPPSMGFSRQGYCSGMPLPSPYYPMSEWVKSLSHVWLFVTPWMVTYQAPLSIGFSRQEYWNGLPFPSPGDLPNPGIKPRSPTL